MAKDPWAVVTEEQLNKSQDTSSDPWAVVSIEKPNFTDNPKKEGLYKMTSKEGKVVGIPYGRIEDASKAGYVMHPSDRLRYVKDAAADPNLKNLSPTPGVKVIGKNTSGQPILAPNDAIEGGPVGRFLSSAASVIGSIPKGAIQFFTPTPNEYEKQHGLTTSYDAALSPLERLVEPQAQQGEQAIESAKQGDIYEAVGHGLAAIVPAVGPLAATTGENVGNQVGQGDIAGAIGTLAGNVALYESPRIAKVAKNIIPSAITEGLPKELINNLIRPAAADVKFGKNPAQAILEEHIVGNSLPDIGTKVYAKLHEVGKAIDTQAKMAANAAKVIDISKSLKPIDDGMAQAVKSGDAQLYDRLLGLKKELTWEWKPFKDAKGNVSLRPIRPRNLKMSPEQALQFKRLVGDKVRWTGNDPFQDTLNSTAGSIYGDIKDQVNQAVPGLKDLNERYSNLVGAAKAIERRTPIAERNNMWSLTDIALGASGHIPLAIARKAISLPAIKTRAAQLLYNLSEQGPRQPVIPRNIPAPQPAAPVPQVQFAPDGSVIHSEETGPQSSAKPVWTHVFNPDTGEIEAA